MTRPKDFPRTRGVPPADRLIPDWYEKVFLRWAIRKPHRFRSYWATVARVLHDVREPMTVDEMLLHEATVALLPDNEADNHEPWVDPHEHVADTPAPVPYPSFALDLERLLVARGVAPMSAEHYGAIRTEPLPAGDEVEALRTRLEKSVEPILRDLVRQDPDIRRSVRLQMRREAQTAE